MNKATLPLIDRDGKTLEPLKATYPGEIPEPSPEAEAAKEFREQQSMEQYLVENGGEEAKEIKENRLPYIGYQQTLFIDEYLIDGNATKAYQRVFRCTYAAANASGPRFLALPVIQERIQVLMNKRSARLHISMDDVVLGIREVIDRCMQYELPKDKHGNYLRVKDEYGDQWVKAEFNGIAALKGYELLARCLAVGFKGQGIERNPNKQIC